MSSMRYQDLVADSAFELWFPNGLEEGQTVEQYSYEDDVVKQHVMPLLPAGSTRVAALAMCLDSTKHDAILSFGLQKVDHELDRVEIWTSHPLGWVLKNKVRPHGRLMVLGAPADGSRMDQAWPVDKKQGVEFGFQKKCIYFMEYPQFKLPLAEHHWCVLVTYRLPSLKVKAPAKLTRAAVETMLTTVIKSFSTTHATALPDAKKLKEVAKKRYGDQRCTVFEFLNAYQLDMAAKVGGDPLKLPPPVPRPKTKGVQGPTDDEMDETEAETAAETKTNGKGKKKAVKKVAVETMCQARRWLAPWANQVGPEVMIRVTDAPFAKEDLLRACRGESTNTYLSNARDVVNAILAFIDGPEAPPAFVNPRCVDIHNTIPCDAFNQRVPATEEMIRVCDRFVLRLKALRQLSPAQRVAMVQCTTPIPSDEPSGLLREDALRVLEHVTQLELAAVVGLRQLSQWRTSFWCFYSKALEPLHGDEVHASLEICQVFFDRTLQLFTQRTPAPEVSPKRPRPPVTKKKAATTKTKSKSTASEEKKKKKKKKKKPNGKAEVSDAGSGSGSSSDSDSSSGSDSSSDEDDDDEAPKAKKAKASAEEDEDEEEDKEDPVEATERRQSMLFLQRIKNATKLDAEDDLPFSRFIFPKKTPDITKQDPLKHPMELNPAVHGFFNRLCKAVNLKAYTARLGDGGRSSGYVFQVPTEAESFLILPFDPLAPSPTTGVDLRNGLESRGCVMLSSKPNSQLEQAYLDLGRRSADVQRFLEGMALPKRPPVAAASDEVVPMET